MAPEKAPAFQFYPKDFLTDGRVTAMSLQERGAYITLLCLCWLEHSLPTDLGKLARMVGVPVTAFRKLWPALSPCFTETDAGLTHKRLEMERTKQAAHRQRQSDKGSKGAEARWPKDGHGHRTAIAQAVPKHSSPISSLRSPKLKNTDRATEPPDPRVKQFLEWFPNEYKRLRHGADYLVKFDKDGPMVKTMLKTTTLERLQKLAQVMLSDKCDEPFIVDTDRGIGILSVKFNWLSERLAAWEARQKASA